ncbi:MAG: glycosyltransferase family 4 protein [Acidobacteriota bacterium]
MRILYFVQYFNLPHEPGGSRPYQFARAWTQAGHEVTVVTGAVNHKTLSVPERYRGKLVAEEDVDGIRLLRVWSYAGIRGSFKKRLLNFGSYAASAALVGLFKGGRPDLVYASTTPLLVGLPGVVTSHWRNVPFVFEVRDLWPQSAVVAGILRPDSLGTRLAAGLARYFYDSAARCVAVTQGIADGLHSEGQAREKLLFVPNGVDDWMVDAARRGAAPRRETGDFEIVYCGAHGKWNGLGQVLDAARLVQEDPSIHFRFIGDGDEREALMNRAQQEGLSRCRFEGAIPKQAAFEAIRSAGASVVVTWAHPFQRMVLANKIFDYLAAGRPVIVAAEGEMKTLVDDARCGITVRPEQPQELAAAIRRMAALSATERDAMGQRGQNYILERYQRADLADRLLTEFAKLTGQPARLRPRTTAADAPRPQTVRS